MSIHLDHSGLVVRDLDHAARQMTAMGFALTPRSFHTVPNADGSLRPAGTANHCAMLERGYLEIIAVTDPAAVSFSRDEIGGFAKRFEGLHLLAMGTTEAGALEASLHLPGRDLSRAIGNDVARFRLVPIPPLSGVDMTFFFIEHRTRSLLWTPELLVHPNGATGLLELVVLADDLEGAGKRYADVLGSPVPGGDGILSFPLDRSRFLVMTPEAAGEHFGAGVPEHALPHCAGQSVEVRDLATAAAVLEHNGVAFVRHNGRLTVAPPDAGGAFLQFAEVGK